MHSRTRISAQEYLAQPESKVPTHLLDGEMIVSPAPSTEHQLVVGNLYFLVRTLGAQGKAFVAPIDVYFDEQNIPQPDVLWIAPNNQRVTIERRYIKGAPDLIIEVVSPGTEKMDRGDKFQLYEGYGVREYWIANPVEAFIEVWRSAEGKFRRVGIFESEERFESVVLKATISVEAIFTE